MGPFSPNLVLIRIRIRIPGLFKLFLRPWPHFFKHSLHQTQLSCKWKTAYLASFTSNLVQVWIWIWALIRIWIQLDLDYKKLHQGMLFYS